MSTFEIIMAIINVAAIIIVPIAAVFVGQKLQDRNQKRKDKMAIFQCLMTHRATGWAHQDTVNALNTIDIIFVEDESVRKCWADLFSKYKPNYSIQEITTAQCKEHHLTRLPVLERLLLLGWEREQIICPSPNSDDTEWHVPKTPSEATNRESKRSFKGYPVDIALFDDVEFVNDYEHIVAIIECKEPNKNEGISQLKIYLGLEPHARLGIWTNGTEFVRVYKLPSAGDFKVVEGAGLPKPTENFILAGDKRITYSDLQIPSTRELKSAFSSLLGVLTSRDTRSTRREDQLNQMSNILLIKLESDHDGQWDKNESLLFQLSDSPAQTHKSVNNAFADYKRRHPVLFATDEPDSIVLDSDTIQEIVLRLQGMNIGEMAPTALSMAFQVFRDATLKLGDGQY